MPGGNGIHIPWGGLGTFVGHGVGARARALVTGTGQEEFHVSITVPRRHRARASSPDGVDLTSGANPPVAGALAALRSFPNETRDVHAMAAARRFPKATIEELASAKILGVRAGTGHR